MNIAEKCYCHIDNTGSMKQWMNGLKIVNCKMHFIKVITNFNKYVDLIEYFVK